jgi:hypothetical protein
MRCIPNEFRHVPVGQVYTDFARSADGSTPVPPALYMYHKVGEGTARMIDRIDEGQVIYLGAGQAVAQSANVNQLPCTLPLPK